MSLINKNHSESSRNKISTFNSKLFFDIELSDENILSNINTEDSEISIKTSSIQLKDYLSNDLIEELELPLNNSNGIKKPEEKDNKNISSIYLKEKNNKNLSNDYNKSNSNSNINNEVNIDLNNNINGYSSTNYNPLIPLINKGYEFTPRNLQNINKITNYSNNHMNNSYNLNRNKKYVRKNKKDDWYCTFCNNLNYSFRIKCNRCGSSRELSDYFIYQKLAGKQKNNFYRNENENKKE